ncbi:hypothetical protein AVEN_241578-1 [Araneus ventricosus]|uniref:Secreted protein n=1 Tax=Araneus ventricosus TaxID=182803 RepID=A0A4Y2H6B7_ARAVE|nr:hypothetical protein AVEN_241578-1 [Araneus ventricosus]
MFTLPALLYLKLLPLFGQCLYHLIVPNKSRPPYAGGALPAGPLPALHPFWVGRASVGIFTPYHREDVRPTFITKTFRLESLKKCTYKKRGKQD